MIVCVCVVMASAYSADDTLTAMRECRLDQLAACVYVDLKELLKTARWRKWWIESEVIVDAGIVRDGATVAVDLDERRSAIELGVNVRADAFYGRCGVGGDGSDKPYVIRCTGKCVGRVANPTPSHIHRLLPLLFDGHSTYGSDLGYSQGDYENRRRLSGYDQGSGLQVLQGLSDLLK